MEDSAIYNTKAPDYTDLLAKVTRLTARAEKAEAQAAGEAGPFFVGFQRRAEQLQHEYFAMKQRAERAEAAVLEAREAVLRLKVELAEQEVDKLDLILERVNQRGEIARLTAALKATRAKPTPGHDLTCNGNCAICYCHV